MTTAEGWRDYHESNPPHEPEFAGRSDLDSNGGRWVAVVLPESPTWEVAVYLDAAGRTAGFKIAPRGETLNIGITATRPDELTVAHIRRFPFAQVDRLCRGFAKPEADHDVRDASQQVVVTDGDTGELVDVIPLIDGAGPGSRLEAEAIQRAKALSVDVRRTGRKGTSNLTYATIAARYVEKLSGPKPVEALAAELYLSTSQIRSQIYKARDKGFLIGGRGQGKAGGQLSQSAINLLRTASQ